jgi:hypothetical protein
MEPSPETSCILNISQTLDNVSCNVKAISLLLSLYDSHSRRHQLTVVDYSEIVQALYLWSMHNADQCSTMLTQRNERLRLFTVLLVCTRLTTYIIGQPCNHVEDVTFSELNSDNPKKI